MKPLALLLLSVGVSVISTAQTQLNQLDSAGKKEGKWIVWLDDNWDKTDSAKATYCRYTYFSHGTNIYPMGPCGGKGWKLIVTNGSETKIGKALVLDGEYKWTNAKGKISSEHILKNGEYVSCKEYYSSGELNQHFDYTKKAPGETHGWCVFQYNKGGKLIGEHLMQREKNGQWPKTRG